MTSGQKNSCIEGVKLIKKLVEKTSDIEILVGAGVNSDNIKEIAKLIFSIRFHMTGKVVENSKMEYRNDDVNMGIPGLSEYEIYRTDEKNIRKTAEILKLLK